MLTDITALTQSTTRPRGSIRPKSEEHIVMDTDDMVKCFKETGFKDIHAHRVSDSRDYIWKTFSSFNGSLVAQFKLNETMLWKQLRYKRHRSDAASRYREYYFYICVWKIVVPADHVLLGKILENTVSKVRVSDDSSFVLDLPHFQAGQQPTNSANNRVVGIVVLDSRMILIQRLVVAPVPSEMDRLSFVFRIVKKENALVRWYSNQTGIVETPFFGEITRLYLSTQYYTSLKAPSGHIFMISYQRVELSRCLSIYTRNDFEKYTNIDLHSWVVWKAPASQQCFADVPLAQVFHTDVLMVRYYKRHIGDYDSGFRLFFTIFPRNNAPQKLTNHTWNCSVPNYPIFHSHLQCNLHTECLGAEDEANCSHTTDQCGPGFLALGDACFFYRRRPRDNLTWTEAADLCNQHGGKLASLNTQAKWHDALRILNTSKWYRQLYRWTDGTVAYYRPISTGQSCQALKTCGYMTKVRVDSFRHIDYLSSKVYIKMDQSCRQPMSANILCEIPTHIHSQPVLLPDVPTWSHAKNAVRCPPGHYTHQFMVCDVRAACWATDYSFCGVESTPLYACSNEVEYVPYTLVCDHHIDCTDESDENFCDFFKCGSSQYSCESKQCVPKEKRCDGWEHCANGEDEILCPNATMPDPQIIPPPAVINLDDRGVFFVTPLNVSHLGPGCPSTHFRCPGDGYCLPVFLRCNGVKDCPGHEDERNCSSYDCPGFYRCRASTICLHQSSLCDRRPQCPQQDDELLCGISCPPHCLCHGLEMQCPLPFSPANFTTFRWLDASGSNMTAMDLNIMRLLVFLRVDGCSWTDLADLFLPNLRSLYLFRNSLQVLLYRHLQALPALRHLDVSQNPLQVMLYDVHQSMTLPQLTFLSVHGVPLPVLNVTVFSAFPSLRRLNLSHCQVRHVMDPGFQLLPYLRDIDLRGCSLSLFPQSMFWDLQELQTVHADTFKACCPSLLPPHFIQRNCHAPADEVSSCHHLLQSDGYTAFVFVFFFLSIIGNATSFVYRTFLGGKIQLGFEVLVTHLSVSDFLMGVYLAIIGGADMVYRGKYVWYDLSWRHSLACQVAGFLSLLSSEVSALIMCLITLDRFLVLRFPLSQLRLSVRRAHVVCATMWVCGLILAAVPVLPVTSHWQFYSQTGICIPLPITRQDFSGHTYSFSIVIALNFVLFLLISVGQLSIYRSVRANLLEAASNQKNKEATIARRLISVAMSDFLCWFPIGVLGLLAACGLHIPSEVNVAVAIFVLPVNAALNPSLYTINVILERRERFRFVKMVKELAAATQSRLPLTRPDP